MFESLYSMDIPRYRRAGSNQVLLGSTLAGPLVSKLLVNKAPGLPGTTIVVHTPAAFLLVLSVAVLPFCCAYAFHRSRFPDEVRQSFQSRYFSERAVLREYDKNARILRVRKAGRAVVPSGDYIPVTTSLKDSVTGGCCR